MGGKQLTLVSFFGTSASSKANTPATIREAASPAAPTLPDGKENDHGGQPLAVELSVTPADKHAEIPPIHPGDLCDYEQQREARIARNRAVLHSLGLLEEVHALAQTMQRSRAPKSPAKRKRPCPQPPPPLRRSTRSSSAQQPEARGQIDAAVASPPVVATYAPSVAASYVCEQVEASPVVDVFDPADVTGVGLLGRCYSSKALPRIYRYESSLAETPTSIVVCSLDVRGGLLAAAGKGGQVALWGLDWSASRGSEEAVVPLMTAKLHRGWVADVQLVGGGQSRLVVRGCPPHQLVTCIPTVLCTASPLLLLTASNDGCLALWDAALVGPDGTPKRLGESTGGHQGALLAARTTR